MRQSHVASVSTCAYQKTQRANDKNQALNDSVVLTTHQSRCIEHLKAVLAKLALRALAMNRHIGPEHKQQGTQLRITCPSCIQTTLHTAVLSAEYHGADNHGSYSVDWSDTFQVVECNGCQTRSFRRVSRSSEDVGYDPETGEMIVFDNVELYPRRQVSRVGISEVFALPYPIQNVYLEVLQALRNEMPVLAGIGIRALVESLCRDCGADVGSLERKIDHLSESGVMSKSGAEILHSLRLLGNEAAHEVKHHPLRDLEAAMDVIEHALVGIYVLPRRAERLPKRSSGLLPPG